MTSNSHTIFQTKFSGKPEDWSNFLRSLLMYVKYSGKLDVLEPKDPSIPALEKNNDYVYLVLNNACSEDYVSSCIMEEARTKEHPHGDARLAWTLLKQKFELNTGATRLQL